MKRSKHSLSHYKLLTGNMGKLMPVGLTEVLPGDSIQQATSALIRVSPLLAPVMHPVHVKIHHWFVPHRIIWDDWENFITGGPDGMNASVLPTITFPQNGPEVGSLADYFGITPDNPQAAGTTVSALPFRAYAAIFNEFYRDQDFVSALALSRASGPDSTTSTTLQNVAWEKDYFTTARLTPQKGPDVTLPLGTTAPVQRVSNAAGWLAKQAGSNSNPAGTEGLEVTAAGNLRGGSTTTGYSLDPNGGLIANLEGASAATINELRVAFAIQRYQEARSRYGSRYVEYLRYLGVKSSDARLQRPEYLGGGKQTIQFSEVIQTAPGFDSAEDEQIGEVGDLKGHGIAAVRSNRYRRFFEEHGYVITLLSVCPKTIYAQAVPRHWFYATKEDFFQKELQHVGQQEVYNREIYSHSATPTGVFGYQDRYDHLRRAESSIAGQFRTDQDFWHMARIFDPGTPPALNSTFIQSNPTDRVFAVPSQDTLWIMANHSIQARRLVAKEGTSI